MALHYAEENPDEIVAALNDKTEAVIRELEALTDDRVISKASHFMVKSVH